MTKRKQVDAEKYLKEIENADQADVAEQLNKPSYERSIRLNSDEYSALRRLMDIEYPISEAANWVASQMHMESQAHIDDLHGRGVEKVSYTMRLDKPLANSVDEMAAGMGIKRSAAIREALVDWLKKPKD